MADHEFEDKRGAESDSSSTPTRIELQGRIGRELARPLNAGELRWVDAPLGAE